MIERDMLNNITEGRAGNRHQFARQKFARQKFDRRKLTRRGVTLIELLVVMGLVVVLAAISLPSIKNTMKDHRTSEAARLVQGFLESCRAKAIASNRPVAAILERVGTTNANVVALATCTRLSMGEVFPPYEGDWTNSTGVLSDTNADGHADLLTIPLAQASALTAIASVGDTIELGRGRHRFAITGITTANGPPAVVQVAFTNPVRRGVLPLEETRWPLQAGTADVQFRVYRKPSKSMSGSVLLPRGTCIDLGQSGFGPGGTELGSSTAPWDSRRSIFIVFNPRGAVETVYEFQQQLSGTATNIPAFSVRLGQMHLLIGKSDQVDTMASAVSERDDFVPNLFDTSNKWVSLNSYNGLLHTSDLAPVVPATPVVSARDLATRHARAKE